MPKYKPSHPFNDKKKKQCIGAGQSIELTEDRANEIAETLRKVDGYKDFVLVREDVEDLDKLKKDELLELAKDLDVDESNTKAEIIEALEQE